MTLADYATFIADLNKQKVIYKIIEDENQSTITSALLNIDKIKEIGWSPSYTVKEGLKRTFEIMMEDSKLL